MQDSEQYKVLGLPPVALQHHITREEQKSRWRAANRDKQWQCQKYKRDQEIKKGKQNSVTGKLIKGIDLVVSANTEVSQERTSNSNIIAVKSNPKRFMVRKDGKPRKVKQRSHTNWYAPRLWPMIDDAARKTRFKAWQLLKYLDRRYSSLGYFKILASGTVQHWIEKINSVGRNLF